LEVNKVKCRFIECITLKINLALVKAEQDCFKELFEAVNITRRISWLHLAAVSSRPSDQRPENPVDGHMS